MRIPVTLLSLLLYALTLGIAPSQPARAEAPPAAKPGDTITWMRNVPAAFEKAKKDRKVLMICINSTRVDGKKREEPAAKGLREVVYKDPRVVTESRKFVCVFLTPAGAGEDYGELGHRFGIEGYIVSPQHIFAHPDHETGRPLLRLEYWSYGQGERAVKELLALMRNAQAKYRAAENLPEPPPEDAPSGGGAPEGEAPAQDGPAPNAAPDAEEARAAWIQEILALVSGGSDEKRKEALIALVTNDREGDCLKPLAALLPTLETEPQQLDVIRTLGRDKIAFAAPAVEAFLSHKSEVLRGNAAVTLEYIGSPESVQPLSKRLGREKVESIHNNLARALGRCGAADAKVRSTLIKRASPGKTPLKGMGAIIGLSHFKKDAKAARAVEKMLKKMGPPAFGRRAWRGAGQGTLRRALLAWTLAEIGDEKSAKFVEEELLHPLRNIKSRFVGAVTGFYAAVARVCRGEGDAMADVEAGLMRSMEWGGGSELKDAARKNRDTTNYTPKADWDVKPGGFGGGGGNNGGGRGSGD